MSATDKPDSKTKTAERFSIDAIISFSDFADVAQTLVHAVTIFGADIFTGVALVFFALVIFFSLIVGCDFLPLP